MMLISQSLSEAAREQGCSAADFAQLRRHLGDPVSFDDTDRQRLMEFTRRLAHVRAMGDEYLRVDLSDDAKSRVLEMIEA